MAPNNITTGEDGGYLAWLSNTTNGNTAGHNVGVEFDTFQNPEFNDLNNNHGGVNVNSLNSIVSQPPAMYLDRNSSHLSPINMSSRGSYAWIEYDGVPNVTVLNDSTRKPPKPLISETVDLTGVLDDFMFVGFTSASTKAGQVLSWTLSTNGPVVTVVGTPNQQSSISTSKIVIPVSVSLSLLSLFLITLTVVFHHRHQQRRNSNKEKMSQMAELDRLPDHYGAHKIRYKDVSDATGKFSEKKKLGKGGFGWVYNVEVAVKRIGKASKQGARELMADVKIIGRMRHRNLVPLLGWCHHKSKGELLLVYEYMPKGSLEQLLFHTNGASVTIPPAILLWEQRLKILIGVATALQFLHEDYEQCVVHRDVKASNVMLDADFNARLGDFGLARFYDHNQGPQTTMMLAGTRGYMAPELFQDGKATKQTDAYSFGALTLETATGYQARERHPDGKALLDWVWSHFSLGKIMDVANSSLGKSYDEKELELVLHMGLLCLHPDPNQRPTMSQILSYLKMEDLFPIHMPLRQRPLFIPSEGVDNVILNSSSVISQLQVDKSQERKRDICPFLTIMTSD